MKIKKSRSFTASLLTSLLLAAPLSAMAVPITGGIGFGGAFAPTGGTDLSDATGINFITAFVLGGAGTYAGIPGFTGASFTDFDFDPQSTPVAPLWTTSFDGIDYSFDLLDVSVDDQDSDILNLSGTGTLMATGYDATDGLWTFSGNAAGTIVFTFSSITRATAVPEPTTLLLLGLGLVGMGAARRRRARSTAVVVHRSKCRG